MKKIFTKVLLNAAIAVLCLTSNWQASAQGLQTVPDRVYIEDFEIEPGQTKLLEVWLESTVSWNMMYAKFELPDGLEMVNIDPEELPEGYTFEPVNNSQGYGNMIALSTNFGNYEYWDPVQVEHYENDPETYSQYGCTISYSPYPAFMIVSNLSDFTFNKTLQIALLKVRANDQLAQNATLSMTESFFWTPVGGVIGSEDKVQVTGAPTVTRVKRASGTSAINEVAVAKPALTDGAYYDMQGRRMAEPTAPGIYIHNGKKVVIK